MNLPPGQTILSHMATEPIVIVSFDITNMPNSGVIEILTNTDPIAEGLGGTVDSFYNANIDETSTQDYFSGVVLGLESINFETLGLQENNLTDLDISIYPNPIDAFINIQTNHDIDSIELYNILGKLVLQTTTKTIDAKELGSGVYFLKIKTRDGNLTKRIIKK